MKALLINNEPVTNIAVQQIIKDYNSDAKLHTASNDIEIQKVLKNNNFDLVIFYRHVASFNSITLIKKIKKRQEDAKVLVVCNPNTKIEAVDYIRVGVHGFITKNDSREDFILAIKLIMSGKLHIPSEVVLFSSKYENVDKPFKKLSEREQDIFKLIIQGKRVKDVSETLDLHQSTVSTLKKRIMKKFKVNNLIDLKLASEEYGHLV